MAFKLIFKFDKGKDIWNWWHACNRVYQGLDWKQRISKNIWKHLYKKNFEEARTFLDEYLDKVYSKDKGLALFRKKLPVFWKRKEKSLLVTLQKITDKPVYPATVTCYYTTFPRGPYDIKKFRWLQMPFFKLEQTNEEAMKTYCRGIMHELLHFQFHHYYWDFAKKQGLTKNQIDSLKEATTVLLNYYFYPKILDYDKGYKIHENLREDLLKIWKRKQDFSYLIVESSKLMKNKYSALK